MEIMVAVKTVPVFTPLLRLAPDGCGLQRQWGKLEFNPWDQVALEAALRLREAGQARRVVAVTVGPAREILDSAVAMGADAGIHIQAPAVDAEVASKALAEEFGKGYQLLLMGQQANDTNAGEMVALVAARAQLPGLTFVQQLDLEDGAVVVRCERDGWSEEVRAPLPCVLGVDGTLNEPRYCPQPGFARPCSVVEERPFEPAPRRRILSLMRVSGRQEGEVLDDLEQLHLRLQEDGLL